MLKTILGRKPVENRNFSPQNFPHEKFCVFKELRGFST
jgi:hypothetical protein